MTAVRRRERRLRRSHGLKLGYIIVLLVFLYLPILVMIGLSFNASESRAQWTGFTFDWYARLFRDERILSALQVTFSVAVMATIASTVIGTLAAIGMHSMKQGWSNLLTNVAYLPMTTPDIVTGVSLMLMFVFVHCPLTKWTMLCAHVAFDTPYVLFSVLPRLRQMDPNLYEAAQDLGCPPVRAFFKVVLPEITPGIVTGAIMAFTLSIDDFVISYFTSGTTQTLPIYIYSMTRRRISPEINALSTVLFAAVLVLLVIVNMRQAKDRAPKGEQREEAGA